MSNTSRCKYYRINACTIKCVMESEFGKISSIARCNPSDKFDENKGKRIALLKCIRKETKKMLKKKAKDIENYQMAVKDLEVQHLKDKEQYRNFYEKCLRISDELAQLCK